MEKLKILHLEDDPLDAQLVEKRLQADGLECEIELVSTEEAFTKALGAVPLPDVVLADYKVPGFDGLIALKMSRDQHPEIPFLFLSGSMGEELAIETLKAGAVDYVIKDRPERLAPAIRRALDTARERRERKEAEKALKESEEKFRRLFQESNDAILMHDLEGRILEVNQEVLNQFGHTESEILAMRVPDLHPPEVSGASRIAFDSVVRDGFVRLEMPFQRKDGSVFPAELSASLLTVSGKQIVQGIVRDITELKRAGEELRLFSTALESAANGVMITDVEGVILWVNPAYCKLTEYSVDEILGENPKILKSDKHDDRFFNDLWETILAGRVWRGEIINRKKSGKLYPEDQTITPLTDDAGKITHFIAIKQDITERKSAVERIRQQAALLDFANDAIFVRDLDGFVSLWNPACESLYGLSREDAVGSNIQDPPLSDLVIQPDDALRQVLYEGEWNGEIKQRTHEGKAITVQSRWTVVEDERGVPRSILEINTDVTTTKILESQVIRAQRMESLGTLAGGIAHDLNNMLTPIMMSIEYLKGKIADEGTQKMISVLERSSKHGAEIIKQILTFARGIEGETVELQPKYLIREMENIVRDTFPKSITVSTNIQKNLWTVEGDATQLHQVLLNLCVNARDAMPSGGVLTISAGNVLSIDVPRDSAIKKRADKYVKMSVTDTGTGIPAEIRQRIFEPFFTTKELSKGTGLGLSTVYTIVKAHDGAIEVNSEPGSGTTFDVYVPSAHAGREAVSASREEEHPEGNGELILVIDDEAAICQIARNTLEAYGYRVQTTTRGVEAVEIFERMMDEIDAIITDMMMPGMDGAETVLALKKIDPNARIVAASGAIDIEAMSGTLGTNVKAFLTKPFTAAKLLETLKQVLADGKDGE